MQAAVTVKYFSEKHSLSSSLQSFKDTKLASDSVPEEDIPLILLP